MISYFTLATIATLHFLFDFVFQTRWMANNKSHNNTALAAHVGVYTLGLIVMTAIIYPAFSHFEAAAAFVVLNAVWHFWTDWHSSKLTSKLFQSKKWHKFFCVIGLDQLIHTLTLFGLFYLLTK